MAISRPILLALVGGLLALGAFYATMGARSSSDESAKITAKPARPKHDAAQTQGKAHARSQKAAASKPRPAAKPEAAAKPKAAAKPGLPIAVSRALAGDRTVVLFFYQRGGADDEATAEAVSTVRRSGRAKVFSAPISRLADYRAVTAGAGVSQAPAVVILHKGRSARLVEGFVDSETLVQQVADAR